jgi:UPF0716 protein FxsA
MAIMVKWFLLGVAALLAAEVVAVVAVASVIGVLPALLLMIATSLAGVAVLRHPGRTRIDRLHEAVRKKGIGGLESSGDAFLTVAAGFLLLLPGFITDAGGLLLLLPPVRSWIAGRFQHAMQTRPSGQPGVVDLERDQWNQVPEQKIEDRRRPSGSSR